VVAIGYPFHGLLTSDFTVTTGIVSSLSGILNDTNRAAVDRACHLVMTRLDHVCDCSRFPAVAERVLQSFDTLTRLSAVDPRRRH